MECPARSTLSIKKLISDDKELAKHYDLDQIASERNELQDELDKSIQAREALKIAPVTYAEYLELFRNISVKLENTHDISLLDNVLRKFFSNFTIKSTGAGKKQRCEITHKLNEPWEGFVKTGNFVRGRPGFGQSQHPETGVLASHVASDVSGRSSTASPDGAGEGPDRRVVPVGRERSVGLG